MKHKLIILNILITCLNLKLEAQWSITKTSISSKGLDYSGFSQAYFNNGDYVLAGNILDTLKLDANHTLLPESNASFFVAYFNIQDSVIWSQRIRSNAATNQLSIHTPIKIGADRSILVAGQFTGSASFPKGNIKSAGSLNDIFWLQFDTKGNFKSLGIYPDANLSATEINAQLEVVISGRTMQNGNNAFVAKSDSLGNVNVNHNYVFTGTKNNRDIITAVNFDFQNNILFAGKANSDSIGFGSHPTYIDAPNDINRYTLFMGKISADGSLKWFKGAVPKPGSRPYQFDIKTIQIQRNKQQIWMSGVFEGANFTIDSFTLATTSTVNTDARKPIILCLDSNGSVQWHSSLGLNGENQRGEIFTCVPNGNGFLLSAEIAHYYFNTLKIGPLDYTFGDRGTVLVFMDSIGNIYHAFGTNPKEKMWASWIHSATIHPTQGIAIALLNNQLDTLNWQPIMMRKGTYLLKAQYCNVKGSIESFNRDICQNSPSTQLKGTNSYGKFYGMGIDSNGIIAPSKLNAGTYPFTYLAVETSGCQLRITDSFRIQAPSSIVFSTTDSVFCPKDTQYLLSATPSGGNFFGAGITNSSFNPFKANTGVHNIYYQYVNEYRCESVDSIQVRVKDLKECEKQNQTSHFLTFSQPIPNPCHNFIVIPSRETTLNAINIYRVDGTFLKTIRNHQTSTSIGISDLPKGPIIIEIENKNTKQSYLMIHD